MKWVKRILLTGVVIFALFYVVSRPNDAADAVQGAINALFGAITSVGQFFTSLAS